MPRTNRDFGVEMPSWYRIRFGDGSPEMEWYGGRGFYYEFPDGSRFGLHPTIAWCRDGRAFVDAEWIPSIDDLAQEIDDLNDPTSDRTSFYTSGNPPFEDVDRGMKRLAEVREETRKRMEWRRTRRSPPRCLTCGSTDVHYPGDNRSVETPDRGTAVVDWAGMCSTDFSNRFFTPEGVRIPRDTKPGYLKWVGGSSE